jgi:hypothetical protein
MDRAEAVVPAWVTRHRITRRLVASLLRRTDTWRFERIEPDAGERALVFVASAIFMIELSHW